MENCELQNIFNSIFVQGQLKKFCFHIASFLKLKCLKELIASSARLQIPHLLKTKIL